MAQLLEHCSLGDDQLKIWKVDCSCIVQDDMRFMQFIHGTTYYDNPYGGKLDLAYWRIYVHNAFHGANLPEIRDYFYFAEVNGTVAARLWFAYAPGNDFGNFGNIFTLHEYRRRGILRKLMPHCIRDFQQTSAKCLACATGSEFAARTYMDYGFKLVYGGTSGTMALVREECGAFTDLAEHYFADVQPVSFREGRIGDQFMVDKFLRYSPELNGKPVYSQLLDYRCCMLEVRNGNGVISVMENNTGAVTGYAWCGALNGMDRLAFMLHPRVGMEGAALLKHLASKHKAPLFYLQTKEDGYGASLLKEAGAAVINTLADHSVLWRFN